MKKNLLLYILLAFLIIVNGFFLYNHLGNSGKKGPKGPGDFIVKELQFDASQMEQFKKLNREHHRKMRMFSDDIRALKDVLFNKIYDTSVKKQDIDSITVLIGNKEKGKDEETFYHFRAIQDICNEIQKEKFRAIVNDALHKQGRKERQGPPKH